MCLIFFSIFFFSPFLFSLFFSIFPFFSCLVLLFRDENDDCDDDGDDGDGNNLSFMSPAAQKKGVSFISSKPFISFRIRPWLCDSPGGSVQSPKLRNGHKDINRT